MSETPERDGFYSALTRSVAEARGAPRQATAELWLQWLDGAQRRGEFKRSERDWVGLDEWLREQPGTIARDAIAAFVQANQVQVQDVVLSSEAVEKMSAELNIWLGDNLDQDTLDDDVNFAEVAEELETIASEYEDEGDARGAEKHRAMAQEARQFADGKEPTPPRFVSYQLPGGEDYRELLLTLPERAQRRSDIIGREMREKYGREDWLRVASVEDRTRWYDEGYRNQGGDDRAHGTFRSTHFHQPNVLAHVRFNERQDAAGKKVLFIEELQSDWHQQGRRQGYTARKNLTDADVRAAADVSESFWNGLSQRERDVMRRELQDAGVKGGVPDAPLKSTDEWALLAFKRMVRWSAERGIERIAWTTGEQQVARYDLSQQVDAILYKRNEDGTYQVRADKNKATAIQKDALTERELEHHVGKEIAAKIVSGAGRRVAWHEYASAPREHKKLAGIDLQVGGDGMRAFYDQILPGAVAKWAKRFGVGIERCEVSIGDVDPNPWKARDATDEGDGSIEAEFPTHAEAYDYAGELGGVRLVYEPGGMASVHSIAVSPAMREAALAGLPLFRREDAERARGAGLGVADAEQLVRTFQAPLGGRGPTITVVATQEQAFGADATIERVGRIKAGLADDAPSTVRVVAGNHADAKDLLRSLRHEVLGHCGLRAMAPEDRDAVLQQVIRGRGSRGLGELWTYVERHYRQLPGDPRERTPEEKAEEVFCRAAEDARPSRLGRAWTRVLAVTAKGLRKVGLIDEAVTVIELQDLALSAARGLRRSQGPEAAAAPGPHETTPRDGFYSALTRSVAEARGAPRQATAELWLQWLDGAQRRGEFKRSERDWVGLDEWLREQPGAIAREAITAFVRTHEVKLSEVVLSQPSAPEQMRAREDAYAAYRRGEMTRASWEQQLAEVETGGTRYGKFQTPGGDRYRELLITLPESDAPQTSTHWPDHTNVLLHVRFNERVAADGMRTLLVEELQSDWHQQGRRAGYGPQAGWQVYDEHGHLMARQPTREAAEVIAEQYRTGTTPLQQAHGWPGAAATVVPVVGDVVGVVNAPFKRTEEWALLGMKRVVRWAVENGFEQVAWTTGLQQAARYDMRHQVREVAVRRHDDGRFDVSVRDVVGRRYDTAAKIDAEGLERHVGKELAERARSQPEKAWRTYEGQDLAVGGNGMIAFYDRILTHAVERWVRRWGAAVTTVDLADAGVATAPSGVHALKLNDAIRAAVIEGLPLFRRDAEPAARVVALIDTRSAAFADVGRQVELARVLRDAAAAIERGATMPLVVSDINGNPVGRIEQESAPSGRRADVRIEIGAPAPSDVLGERLRAAAQRVEKERVATGEVRAETPAPSFGAP